jgi:hypothetical protein
MHWPSIYKTDMSTAIHISHQCDERADHWQWKLTAAYSLRTQRDHTHLPEGRQARVGCERMNVSMGRSAPANMLFILRACAP